MVCPANQWGSAFTDYRSTVCVSTTYHIFQTLLTTDNIETTDTTDATDTTDSTDTTNTTNTSAPQLSVTPYAKPGRRVAYLSPQSSHPRSIYMGIVRGEFLRLSRTSEDGSDYDRHAKQKEHDFVSRGYSRADVRQARQRVRQEREEPTPPPPADNQSPVRRRKRQLRIIHLPFMPQLQNFQTQVQRVWHSSGLKALHGHVVQPMVSYKRRQNVQELLSHKRKRFG